jgi:hypothetical protein
MPVMVVLSGGMVIPIVVLLKFPGRKARKQQATSCDILSRDKINNRQKQQASSDKLRQC